LHVKRGATADAQLVLNHGRGGGKHHVGGGGGHDDEIDLTGWHARGLQGTAGRFKTQIARRHVHVGKVTGPNAGALDNPFVVGFYALGGQLSGQIGIGQAIGGQKAAGSHDF
jgi:hypothetical protein